MRVSGVVMTRRTPRPEAPEVQSQLKRLEGLENAASRFQAILYSIGDGVIAADASGRVSLMNHVAQQLTGWRESEACGRLATEVFHIVNEDTGAVVESPVTRVLREGCVVGLANHTVLIAKDGTRRPIADSGAPVLDQTSNTAGAVLVFRDQSAERSYQQSLVRSERKFRDTVENLDDGYFRITSDGILQDHNPAFSRIAGFEPGRDLRGTSTAALWQVRSIWDACRQQIEVNGSAANLEVPGQRADGTAITLLVSAHLVSEDDLFSLAGSIRDISERKRQELVLRQSEAQYRLLFAANPCPMFIFDEETLRFLAVNDTALQTYGWTRDEFLALSVLDVRPHEDRELARTTIAKNRGKLQTQIGLLRHCRRDGTIVEMEVTVSALDFEGRGARLCAMTDVTARRRTEQILRRHELVVQQSRDALLFLRASDGRILDANPAAMALYGYGHDEFLRLTVGELRVPEARASLAQQIAEAKTKGLLFETLHRRKDGSVFPVEVSSRGVEVGTDHMLISVVRDISERHSAREQLQHLNAVLRGIRNVNQLIVQEKDPQQLIQRACETLVETRGYQGAWIVLQDPDRTVASHWAGQWAHPEARKVFEAALRADLCEWPPCRPLANSVAEGVLAVDPEKVCVDCALRKNRAHERAVVASLRREGKVLGVLGVAFGAGIAIDAEERSLLAEVAGDLAFAVADIELARQRDSFARIVASSRDPMALVASDFTYREANPAYLRGIGWSERSVTGRSVVDVVGRETFDTLVKPHLERSFAGEEVRSEATVTLPDGTRRIVDALYSPCPSTHGLIREVAISVRDITNHREAEQALRASEEQYRSLFQHMLNGVAYCRMIYEDGQPTDFVYLVVNAAFEAQTGLKNVAGKRVSEAIPGLRETDPEVFQIYGGVASTGVPLRFERYIKAMDMWFWVSVFSPRPEHFVAVFDVITERKRAEEERERLQAQLLQAQKMESVGRLAGGIAHDFNNMLGVINGHAELALEKLDEGDPIRADVRDILSAGTRSANLTRQLLTFARRQPRQPKVIDLNQVVDGILKMLRRLIGENIELSWSPAPDLWKVNVDPAQIDQVLANLAVNARDAIARVGTVSLRTGNRTFDEKSSLDVHGAAPGDYVRLSMTDTGSGMDADTMAHIFEPFFTTKGIGQGTGLGLSTVYGVVQQNNGLIQVRSELGQGTTVDVYLPRAEDPHSLPSEPTGGPIVRTGGETILVVEDEEQLLQLVSRILGGSGYRVIPANTPESALRLDSEHAGRIDLVLADLVMPGMSGHDLAQRLLARRPGLKCLYMSGYPAQTLVREGAAQVHLLQKPFSLKALEKAVRDVLDSPVGGPGSGPP